MAGVKITDLVTITEAASNDLLYIVDVSNTTQSPEGTSSQIELGNIVSSGTWTPTISDISGLSTVTILGISTYQRIGNLITDTCRIIVQFDVGEDTDSFRLDLAIPPDANFINARQVLDIYSITSLIPEVDSILIQSFTGSKLTAIPITMNATGSELSFICQRTYQYIV